jgi:hypothetical protein
MRGQIEPLPAASQRARLPFGKMPANLSKTLCDSEKTTPDLEIVNRRKNC